MTFYPRRLNAAILGAAFLVGSATVGYFSHELDSYILVGISIMAFLVSAFLLGPVFKNQIVRVGKKSIVVHSFGRTTELKPDHLTEVYIYGLDAAAYRFQIGFKYYQVTPYAYNDPTSMQREFDRVFDLERLQVPINGLGIQSKIT